MHKQIRIFAILLLIFFASCQNESADNKRAERDVAPKNEASRKEDEKASRNKTIIAQLKRSVAEVMLGQGSKRDEERREIALKVIEVAERFLSDPAYNDVEPELLIILGRSKAESFLGDEFYKSHSGDYDYDKKSGKYYTKGLDYLRVLEKHPKSEFASTAAYYYSARPLPPKECKEGDPACKLRDVIKESEILFTKYPSSKEATQRMRIINARLEEEIIYKELKLKEKEKGDLIALLTVYEGYIANLPADIQNNTLYLIGRVAKRAGDAAFAAGVFKRFIEKFPKDEKVKHAETEIKKLTEEEIKKP
ncbi:MAG: hypothetical protein Kow0090_01630 [Myxococcota bacterium]